MDHHCPWVNNCVGYYNQKHFMLFLLYVTLGSTHAAVKIIQVSYQCYNTECAMFKEFNIVLLSVVSIILAIIFGIFTLCMLVEQVIGVLWGQSTIDKLK
jgi:palmitoyltransferase